VRLRTFHPDGRVYIAAVMNRTQPPLDSSGSRPARSILPEVAAAAARQRLLMARHRQGRRRAERRIRSVTTLLRGLKPLLFFLPSPRASVD
jgi:hypothetical protein